MVVLREIPQKTDDIEAILLGDHRFQIAKSLAPWEFKTYGRSLSDFGKTPQKARPA